MNVGGLAEYLEESLGLFAADVAELMTRDWDCQDAEGLAAHCIENYGGFDWLKLEELLEVDVEPAVLVLVWRVALNLKRLRTPTWANGIVMRTWQPSSGNKAGCWMVCLMLSTRTSTGNW